MNLAFNFIALVPESMVHMVGHDLVRLVSSRLSDLKIILIWFLAQRFSHQQDEIATYDYQALIRNQLIPRAERLANPGRGAHWDYGALPDLGNAEPFFYFRRALNHGNG